MVKFILTKFFAILIGKIPEKQKAEFWSRFNLLLCEVARAAAAGAVEGAIKK